MKKEDTEKAELAFFEKRLEAYDRAKEEIIEMIEHAADNKRQVLFVTQFAPSIVHEMYDEFKKDGFETRLVYNKFTRTPSLVITWKDLV